MRLLIRGLILSALSLGLPACSHRDSKPGDSSSAQERPLAEYTDTTVLDMHDGSRLSWTLKTLHMVKWARSDLIRAEPVELNVFDSLGVQLVLVTADSGAVDEPMNFLMAKGHVHGHSRKGMDLQTDSLRWNRSGNNVSTEAKVRVVSEDGDILTGKGFISDANLDHWQILSNVHGVFQKVDERAKSIDSTPAKKNPAGTYVGGTRP